MSVEISRMLRKRSTSAEKKFWQAVRNRKVLGKKFLRQYSIRFRVDGIERRFIADFCCHEKRLFVELDGAVHKRQRDYDEIRIHVIGELGFRVVRFTNDEVLDDLGSVLARLEMALFRGLIL